MSSAIEASRNLHRVLITGAQGTVGTILSNALSRSFDVITVDIVGEEHGNNFLADIAEAEQLDAVFEKAAHVDVVVHLAASSSVGSPWISVLRNNIVGTKNVYECARKRGVKKIVLGSTNHVTGAYEGIPPTLHKDDSPRQIRTSDPVRPDSDYAVSKVFGEALARYYFERYGIKSVCLRIGTVLKDDDPTDERARRTWLSHRDLVQLVTKSIVSDVNFGIYYGVSNNRDKFWDISDAEEQLGYQPEDDASSATTHGPERNSMAHDAENQSHESPVVVESDRRQKWREEANIWEQARTTENSLLQNYRIMYLAICGIILAAAFSSSVDPNFSRYLLGPLGIVFAFSWLVMCGRRGEAVDVLEAKLAELWKTTSVQVAKHYEGAGHRMKSTKEYRHSIDSLACRVEQLPRHLWHCGKLLPRALAPSWTRRVCNAVIHRLSKVWEHARPTLLDLILYALGLFGIGTRDLLHARWLLNAVLPFVFLALSVYIIVKPPE